MSTGELRNEWPTDGKWLAFNDGELMVKGWFNDGLMMGKK